MQKKGISRRIDELGRIVIPKEIRKNLKIRDSDELDITIDGDNIILNKHEPFEQDLVINKYIYSLGKTLHKNIWLTSKEKIISYYLDNQETLDNLELENEIIEHLEKRKKYDNLNSNIKSLAEYYVIYPLIINGDLIGSIICYSNKKIKEDDEIILTFSQTFLENYLEYE